LLADLLKALMFRTKVTKPSFFLLICGFCFTLSHLAISTEKLREKEEEYKGHTQRSAYYARAGFFLLAGSTLTSWTYYTNPEPTLVGSLEHGIPLRNLIDHHNRPGEHPFLLISRYATLPLLTLATICLTKSRIEKRKLYKNSIPELTLKIVPSNLPHAPSSFRRLWHLPRLIYEKTTRRLAHFTFPIKLPGLASLLRPSSPEIADHFQSFSPYLYCKRLEVDLSGFTHLTPSDLGFLVRRDNIKSLNLKGTSLTDQHCEMFIYAKHLEELDIRDNPAISDQRFEELVRIALEGSAYDSWFCDIFLNLTCLRVDARKSVVVDGSLLRKLYLPSTKVTISAFESVYENSDLQFLSGYKFVYSSVSTAPQAKNHSNQNKSVTFSKTKFDVSPKLSSSSTGIPAEYLSRCQAYLQKHPPKGAEEEKKDITNHLVFALAINAQPRMLSDFGYLNNEDDLSVLENEKPFLLEGLNELEGLISFGLLKSIEFRMQDLNSGASRV